MLFRPIVLIIAACSSLISAWSVEPQYAFSHTHLLARQLDNGIAARAPSGGGGMDWSNQCGSLRRADVEGVIARAIHEVPTSQVAQRRVVHQIMAGLSTHSTPHERTMINDQLVARLSLDWGSGSTCYRSESMSRRELESLVSRTVDDVRGLDRRRRSGPVVARGHHIFARRLTDEIMGTAVLKRSSVDN